MKTFTPGPWSVAPSGGIAADGEVIVCNDVETLIKHGGQPINNGFRNATANARLIACAPELLEALEDLVGIICGERDVMLEDCDEAKRLIAKAKGE